MIELIKNFFDTSNERIKNPLIGSFIIAWFACNWRPLSIFFLSEAPVEERISTIELYASYWFNLFLPLLVSLIYIVILPYIMWGLDRLVVTSTSERKKIKVEQLLEDAQGKKRLAIAESDIEDAKASFREKKDLNQQIEVLKQQISSRDSTVEKQLVMLKELEEKNIELASQINHKENVVLAHELNFAEEYEEFKEMDLFKFFEDIGRGISRNGKIPDFIDILVQEKFQHQGIVMSELNINGTKGRYRFTPKGDYFWKEFVKDFNIKKNL